MVWVKLDLDERSEKIIKRVMKEQHLKSTSQAIEYVATVYAAKLMDPSLRPLLKKKR